MESATSMIAVRGLSKSYGSNTVLRGVDLDVGSGEILALLGPNGAGKTTTVNILTTLVKPDKGTAQVAGFDVVRQAESVRSTISLTGQYASVDEFLTGRENLMLMCRLAHLGGAASKARTAELLAQFDLTDASSRRVDAYSGGMRRRLDLAISLISRPPVVFLDEPTTGLDPRSRAALWAVVRELADTGTTVLLTTQYLEEADQLADTIAVIDGGTVVACDTAAELKRAVGGLHIQLTLDDQRSFDAALRLDIDGIRALEDTLSIQVPTSAPVSSIRELLAAAERDGLSVANIGVAQPTLDDVFLNLTGHHSTTPANEAQHEGIAA